MQTLNLVADKLANLLKQPDNHEVKERIKESFKNLMATYIRQSVEKNGIDEALVLPFEVELVNITYPESIFHTEGIEIKRSKYKIPTPMRIPNSAPFVSVSDGMSAFTYVNEREFKKSISSFPTGNILIYIFTNGYIYCRSTDETHKIKSTVARVESIYENPEEVIDYYNMESDFQDTVLPFPRDILARITTEVLRNEFGVIPNPDEIKVELGERLQ